MSIFHGWENYTERLFSNWNRLVTETDTVVLPGDFSWALKLEDTLQDFCFLAKLPGKKILLKGNHDLWWSSVTKIQNFLTKNCLENIQILFNNAILAENHAVCGTRGWMYDQNCDSKLRLREAGRLRRSLEAAEQTGKEKLVFMHYPPAYGEFVCDEIITLLKQYRIDRVYYGHIHGAANANIQTECEGIRLQLVSADTLNFCPLQICANR